MPLADEPLPTCVSPYIRSTRPLIRNRPVARLSNLLGGNVTADDENGDRRNHHGDHDRKEEAVGAERAQ